MVEMALAVCLVVIFGLCMYIKDLEWWVKHLRAERDRESKFSKALLEKFTGIKFTVEAEEQAAEIDWSDDTLEV